MGQLRPVTLRIRENLLVRAEDKHWAGCRFFRDREKEDSLLLGLDMMA